MGSEMTLAAGRDGTSLVVVENDRPVGIVTTTDFLRVVAGDLVLEHSAP